MILFFGTDLFLDFIERFFIDEMISFLQIRILCGVDHDDLKQLFHVPSTIIDAVSSAIF